MARAAKIILIVIALAAALPVLVILASESGEVVEVTTFDSAGSPATTRLWVVDWEGHAWIRSGDPGSAWFGRLSDNPSVSVTRAASTFAATAVVVPAARDQVNALMREKYALADALIDLLLGRSDAIAIRLEPR